MKRVTLLLISMMTVAAAEGASIADERRLAEHVLNRAAFGPRPGEVERVARMGVDRWIEQQLQPATIDDSAIATRVARYDRDVHVPSRADLRTRRDEVRRHARAVLSDLSARRVVRAAHSERQLEEVMADFWLNHFNVFAAKNLDRFLVTSYEHETIRPRIWGRFEDLLLATAKSPAMLVYLDNVRSRAGAINENYARELMELHTLGVDGGYTQQDVTELARVLTGWSITRPEDGDVRFEFRRRAHDGGAKQVLGIHLAAGGGIEEGERVIRMLARHPSTARFIAYKLAQRFVADEPPAALVDRVAKRFLATNGDLRETVKAVLTSAEFRDPRTYRSKLKRPFEYAISAVRAAGATIHDPLPLARELRKLGEPLYFAQPPTGYSDASADWESRAAIVARLELVLALAEGKLPGVRVPHRDATTLTALLGAPEFQRQ